VIAHSTPVASADLSPAQFSAAYSRYVDGFLAKRSVLDSTLFPEKPAQMWFGYESFGMAMGPLTAWLEERITPAELGAAFHQLGPRAPGIVPASALWIQHAVLTDRSLVGQAWPEGAESVLAYWRRVYEMYSASFSPPGVFTSGATGFQHRLVGSEVIADAAARLDPDAVTPVGPALAAATNYSWLTEAESRQGTYNHGLYASGAATMLVREFVNLGATRYPWIDRTVADLPGTPISVVLRLEQVRGDFDLYGVPRLGPGSYADRITGVAVRTQDGWVGDAGAWMTALTSEVRRAHMALFRTIAGWSPRERFVAGARSYFVMWAPIVELAGGTDADVRRLLYEPLDMAIAERLPVHLERPTPAPLWGWAGGRGDETIFAPVVRGLT
jgi:hypothetical protein